MSNDEYLTSLVNYNRLYFDQSTINTNDCSSKNKYNLYPTALPAKLNGTDYIAPTTITPLFKQPTYQTDNVDDSKNNNYRRNNNNPVKSEINSQVAPMNLITNTGLDLSHSITKPTYAPYFNNDLFSHSNNSYITSPSLSASPSIDVENDINDDSSYQIMSPVSIPAHHQKHLFNDTHSPSQSSFGNMELTAGAIPSGFPLNYRQIYANNAALYGAPVMFSGAIHAAHASYMAGLPLHAALSPNETYLKAIQASACGLYSPTALAPPPPPPHTNATASVNPSLLPSKHSPLHSSSVSSIMAPAPSSQPVGTPKTPQPQQQQYSPNILNSVTETEQKQQNKRECLGTSLKSQTILRPSCTNNSCAGTFLNDKVNERLAGVDATKDSHFKVPNGKEGSLKHRILRHPSSSDGSCEQNKTPVMRTYSTVSNFKKGNYIELANGSLRRVEDMRTEDFIQCAERSPHHQLAESTVVKINTSQPTTAVITFSYDKNRSKVDMEVSFEHPFFVYGQGWASCNPEMSMKMFGLKCQRLQVGDICISLTKREQSKQHSTPSNSLTQINEVASYRARHSIASSPNPTHLTSPSLTTVCSTSEVPYSVPLNNPTFSIPVPQPNHHIQQQQHQAYAEMAKLMSSYAYAKGLPQLAHEQLKDVVMEAAMTQDLPTKMMSVFYQNQIFQLAQQQQQGQLRHTELKNNQPRIPNSSYNITTSMNSRRSPQPTDLEFNHIQQPPQTQPLDITMSRKRRWSAPENMFDDDPDTQPPRNKSSPTTTART